MISAQDELRHPANSGLNWSESYYFTFADSASDTAGFFRIGLEENRQQANMWCSLLHKGKLVYQRFRLNLPYCANGIENLSVGDLQIQMVEALKTFRLFFSDRDLEIDLIWSGFHPVFDMHDAMGDMSTSVAAGHYEQAGEVVGTIKLGSNTVEIHGYGFRDHSWGVRDWEGVKGWRTCVGQFGSELAFAAGEITEHDGNQSWLGYLYANDPHDNDPLTALDRASIQLDNPCQPRSGEVTLVDRRGNRHDLQLEFIEVCHMPYDFNLLLECYVRIRKGQQTTLGIVEINQRLL